MYLRMQKHVDAIVSAQERRRDPCLRRLIYLSWARTGRSVYGRTDPPPSLRCSSGVAAHLAGESPDVAAKLLAESGHQGDRWNRRIW